jgi:iron(III) transport system ATP-binding protein
VHILAQVGLNGYGDKVPYTLSGGEQQRVALARALAPKPRVMLMDEPFSGLDFRLRDQIRDDTLALLQATGTATLLVTHDPDEAMLMANQIVLLGAGTVAQSGSPEELYYRPNSVFVAEFFGEINKLDGYIQNSHAVSPLGIFPAKGKVEGGQVDVMIRPRDIEIDPAAMAGGGIAATVRRARLVGGDRLIDLALDDTDIPLRARLPGTVLPG